MFDWFNATAAKAFGETLADGFAKAVPPDNKLSSKQFAAKAESTLKKMSVQVRDFRSTSKLNMYKKAQLGNAFKWRLKDKGFDDSYVDQLTEWLLEHL